MAGTHIYLHLRNQCIETTAKQEFRRLTDEYIASSGDKNDPETEEKLELLREFLEASDFSGLRASDSRLAGDCVSEVTIARDGHGRPFIIEVHGEPDCEKE